MKWHLLLLAVGVTCHVLTPLCVAATAFLVSLILTWHVPVAVVTAVIALGVASYHARWYSLHAIGPEFIDPDHPVALVCVARHALRLLLLLLLTPVTVLIVGVALRPFNPYSSIVAMVVGIPTQAVVDFLLRVSANVWTWRVRRGRVISTSREIRGKISAYSKRRRLQPSDLTVWGGRYVPRDLMGAHQDSGHDRQRKNGDPPSHPPVVGAANPTRHQCQLSQCSTPNGSCIATSWAWTLPCR